MKKNMILLGIAVSSIILSAFNLIEWNSSESANANSNHCNPIDYGHYNKNVVYSDFFYETGPRFYPIKKKDLEQIKTVSDIVTSDIKHEITSYNWVNLIVVKNGRHTDVMEKGSSEVFSDSQLKLLQKADYSSHFTLRADFNYLDKATGEIKRSHIGPYYTVIPETQAKYDLGTKAFNDYLRAYNKEFTADLNEDKLRPAALYFTVSENGTITNMRLARTSGFDSIDNNIIDLLKSAPGKWIPAKTFEGKTIEQELVISFGKAGC